MSFIETLGGLKNLSPGPDIAFQLQDDGQPWSSVAAAHAGTPAAYRAIGKIRWIDAGDGRGMIEYWYKGGVAQENLVQRYENLETNQAYADMLEELLEQTQEAAEYAKLFLDGVEIEGGFNAADPDPDITADSSGFGPKDFFRVYNSGNSPFAFTNFPINTPLADGDKIRKDGTGWFLEKYAGKTDVQAFWCGVSKIAFDFTAKTITLPTQGFWVKGNTYYNGNLVLNGLPTATPKVINMPVNMTGINYFFADFTTGLYFAVNYPDRGSVPDTASLIATWFDPDGKQLTYGNPSDFAKAADVYTKATIDNRDRWLEWKHLTDVTFDFTARTITIPVAGYWLLDKTYYNTALVAGASPNTGADIVINMSNANSGGFGINYVFADLVGKSYNAKNQTELASSPPPAGSVLIATWFNPTGDYLMFKGQKATTTLRGNIRIATESERTTGTNNSNASTPKQVRDSIIDSSIARWVGLSPIDFNFSTQVISIPSQGFWAKVNQFYNNNLVLSGTPPGSTKTVNMPGAGVPSAGINYFFADFTSGTYYCVNYTNRSTVPTTAVLIASWYDAAGTNLTYFSPSLFARKSTTLGGYGITDAYTKTENNKSTQGSRAFWIGLSPLDFNFTAKTITIPNLGFWSKGNDYYNSNLALSGNVTGSARVINMPASMAGINYFFADFTTATYYCVNYPDRATVPVTATLIATWYDPSGVELTYFSPGIFAKKATSIAGYGITDAYTKTEVDAKIQPFVEASMRLIAPARLFMIDGVPLSVYKSSIVPLSSGLQSFKPAIIEKDNANNNPPRYRYFYEDIQLDSATLKPTVAIGMAQTDNLKMYTQNLAISRVTQASLNGKTPKIMLFGDSLTNRGLPAQVKTQLAKYGVTATMVGTMDNTGGERGEGREGWEYENYIGKDNNHSTGGSVILPSSTNPSDIFKNPFLKLATASDKTNFPDWCFRNTGASEELTYTSDPDKTGNFYIFDFANYLSTTSTATPDVLLINLWTNDQIQDGVSAGITQSLLAMEIMIRQIKAAVPAIKIGIAPAPVRGISSGGNSAWSDNCQWIENCMQKVKALTTAGLTNLSVVPIWMHTNRDWNFPVTSTALNATNDTQVNTVSDSVHWNTEGTIENAVAIASYLANVI